MPRGPVHTVSAAGAAGARGVNSEEPHSFSAPASIAPVGLEVAAEADLLHEGLPERNQSTQQTASIRLPMPRRRLGGIVVAAVAGCALILVAAVIARVSHASSEPSVATPAKELAKDQTPAALNAIKAAADPARPSSPSVPSVPAAAQPMATAEAPATGTLRLEHPAAPGRVWVDGKKVTSSSALVSCGTHQIKVGVRGRTRSVQVPCDGEVVISK
jgi:hypothetical protein